MPRLLPLLATLLLAACGGSGSDAGDAVENVPEKGGVRDKVAAAQKVEVADFPAPGNATFDELAAQFNAREGEVAQATSVFTPGTSRFAFGSITGDGQFAYGKSAVYVASRNGRTVAGPFPAPADILITDPAYRSKQAATEADPFAAVYAADVNVARPGTYQVLTVTQSDAGPVAATGAIAVKSKGEDKVPDVGEPLPKVATDTLKSVNGDEALLDTREPASDMHKRSLEEVAGRKPVAILFATPQLCQSRVCGPVVDVLLQLEATYGDRMEFIHQEVYKDNNPDLGLRPPLVAFHLETEPWLFVADAKGRITARLEGSFGLQAVEQAIKTGL